jgi:menaquinone-dependent protoporphyrinogen oxidase
MCEVPVFYAAAEGHTREIAEHVAARVRQHGLDSRAVAIISDDAAQMDWQQVRGVAIGAALYGPRHQPEAVAFARVHHDSLSALPSAFFSVSRAAAPNDEAERQSAERLAASFGNVTGWTPTRTAAAAGRRTDTPYSSVVRLLMRRMALREGASTDTNRERDATDWARIDALADDLAYDVRRRETFPLDERMLLRAAS